MSGCNLKPIDDGKRLLTREDAPSLETAWPVVQSLVTRCPVGYHTVRVEVRKSAKGRRAHCTVTFQRNAARRRVASRP